MPASGKDTIHPAESPPGGDRVKLPFPNVSSGNEDDTLQHPRVAYEHWEIVYFR